MPRAKVRDEDRQRARKACIPCKNSKIRCDANQPCSHCIRKDCKAACQYLVPCSRRQDQSHRPTKVSRRSSQHTHPASTSPSGSSHPERDGYSGRRNSDDTFHTRSSSTHVISAPSPEVTHPRMLLSSKGEKIFVGNYSHLSLLQFLRQTVRHHIGPSAFSEATAMDLMLEADINEFDDIDIGGEDLHYKESLIQCYLEASAGVIDVCADGEISNLLSATSQNIQMKAPTPEDRAVLYLIMAIGAQCRGRNAAELKFAAICFQRARAVAFDGHLCDPSINMVRIFVLLAFYMLGVCRRNAAFMYLGVASKAACALGLHSRSQYPNVSKDEQELRSRIWKSLYVLDTLTNVLLGRPGSLPLIQPRSLEQKSENGGRHTKSRITDAAYGACVHIATVVPNLSKSSELDPSSTETFLECLGRWRESAMPAKRRYTFGLASLSTLETIEQQIGDLHVACTYYFAVILVTKPFLLSHLTHTLRQRTSGNQEAQPLMSSGDERIGKLGQACIDASSYMTQLCKDMLDSGGLLDNMIMVQAFMFAAGLLLAYSNFVDGKASECEEPFRAAQAVLKKLSTLSPQARHYHEILHDFDSAVSKYQQLQHERRRRVTGRYVKPVFAIDPDQDAGYTSYPTPSTGGVNSNPNSGLLSSAQVSSSYTGGGPLMDVSGITMDNSIAFASDGSGFDGTTLDMPLFWDDANFDWQLFSAFPDEVNIGM